MRSVWSERGQHCALLLQTMPCTHCHVPCTWSCSAGSWDTQMTHRAGGRVLPYCPLPSLSQWGTASQALYWEGYLLGELWLCFPLCKYLGSAANVLCTAEAITALIGAQPPSWNPQCKSAPAPPTPHVQGEICMKSIHTKSPALHGPALLQLLSHTSQMHWVTFPDVHGMTLPNALVNPSRCAWDDPSSCALSGPSSCAGDCRCSEASFPVQLFGDRGLQLHRDGSSCSHEPHGPEQLGLSLGPSLTEGCSLEITRQEWDIRGTQPAPVYTWCWRLHGGRAPSPGPRPAGSPESASLRAIDLFLA